MIFLHGWMLFKSVKIHNFDFQRKSPKCGESINVFVTWLYLLIMEEKLYIRNMVCDRCKMVVKAELEQMGLRPLSVELGEVKLDRELTDEEKRRFSERLQELGFSLIDNKKSRLIEQVKTLIIELVHHRNSELSINLSDHLKQHIHHDYHYLSSLFSEVAGTTIEKYFIAQKIEKVKELLVYDELSLSEIADQLNYSSVGYLSSQFKKVTGFTPSRFRKIKEKKRKPLDQV